MFDFLQTSLVDLIVEVGYTYVLRLKLDHLVPVDLLLLEKCWLIWVGARHIVRVEDGCKCLVLSLIS